MCVGVYTVNDRVWHLGALDDVLDYRSHWSPYLYLFLVVI